MLELSDVHNRVSLGYTNRVTEIPNRFGRVSTPAEAAQSRHPRVVPAADNLFIDESQELSLAHYRVIKIQTREFDLHRPVGDGQVFNKPIIKRTVIFEFQ